MKVFQTGTLFFFLIKAVTSSDNSRLNTGNNPINLSSITDVFIMVNCLHGLKTSRGILSNIRTT